MSWTFQMKNGDITYGVGGQPSNVTGKMKLSQDLGEAAQSPIDDIGFGFGIEKLVGQVQDPDLVPSLLDQRISDGIRRLISLQENNQSLSRDDAERIDSIASTQAGFKEPGSRTDFAFSFAVRSVDAVLVRKRGAVSNA